MKPFLRNWGVSVLPILMLSLSAAMKFSNSPDMAKQFEGTFGWPPALLPILGVLEVACVAIYVFPRTAVLGAILLTGYLGGAVATHLRIGDNFIAPVVLGVLVWLGLYLRDARLRALLPLISPSR